jgi:hypothetical protein
MSATEPQIVFICQPGELEAKSLFLAYSLEQFQQGTKYALVPAHLYAKLSKHTVELFTKLNTQVVKFHNPYIRGRRRIKSGDWMSNKFYALQTMSNQKDILFLDSDIIQIKLFPDFSNAYDLSAKPADVLAIVYWDLLFKKVGLPYSERTTRSTVDKKESPPYFNSGVLYLPAHTQADLLNAWKDYFITISDDTYVSTGVFDIFHRDQLALSLAIEKLSLDFLELDEALNFPVRRRNKIDDEVIFAHYHTAISLKESPVLLDIFNRFVVEYPLYKLVLKGIIDWKLLAEKSYKLLNAYQHYLTVKRKIVSVLKS